MDLTASWSLSNSLRTAKKKLWGEDWPITLSIPIQQEVGMNSRYYSDAYINATGSGALFRLELKDEAVEILGALCLKSPASVDVLTGST